MTNLRKKESNNEKKERISVKKASDSVPIKNEMNPETESQPKKESINTLEMNLRRKWREIMRKMRQKEMTILR